MQPKYICYDTLCQISQVPSANPELSFHSLGFSIGRVVLRIKGPRLRYWENEGTARES